ncbi:MAG TPA: hypothetical protein VE422_27070 [Terriglobia bacterium]|nr:hypothetical protein [Terriglobia bacterium]
MREINPYLTNGNCREAMKFHQKCLGAELQMMPFSEAPMDSPPDTKDRIMHARLAKGGGFWGARFGMLTDQFGVSWMFNFEQPK